MTFDPTSVEVTCVTVPKDHYVQVPWEYVNVCGYSYQFCKNYHIHTYTHILRTYYVHTTYYVQNQWSHSLSGETTTINVSIQETKIIRWRHHARKLCLRTDGTRNTRCTHKLNIYTTTLHNYWMHYSSPYEKFVPNSWPRIQISMVLIWSSVVLATEYTRHGNVVLVKPIFEPRQYTRHWNKRYIGGNSDLYTYALHIIMG